MKQFYVCEPKHDLNNSKRCDEWVEYDINTFIYDEAEMILTNDNRFDDMSDEEFFKHVGEKAKEIKEELMINGIYKNKFGQPLFLYC